MAEIMVIGASFESESSQMLYESCYLAFVL